MIAPAKITVASAGSVAIAAESTLDPRLAGLIEAITQPENQGEALRGRDYVFLLLATVLLPVALIIVGGQL
jgi:hypothetical protein